VIMLHKISMLDLIKGVEFLECKSPPIITML
jgi:hypothetical protein